MRLVVLPGCPRPTKDTSYTREIGRAKKEVDTEGNKRVEKMYKFQGWTLLPRERNHDHIFFI